MSRTPLKLDVAGATAVLPRGLTSFGAAVSDGSLFVLGGYFGRPHAYSKAGQTGDLMRLDLRSGAWEQLGGIDPAQSIALVAHKGRVVRVGGMEARNEDGTEADLHSLDTVEAFDLATSTWTSLPPLPGSRSSHDAVVLGDALWVVGGWAIDGDTKQWRDTAARLDLGAPDQGWVEVDAPFKRRALAVAATEDRLVAIGGIDDGRNLSQRVDVFDPGAGEWSKGPTFPGPGFGVAAVGVGKTVFASGMDGVVHRWTVGDEAWQRVTTLAYPRFFHRLVASGIDELLAVGGIRQMATGVRVRPIEPVFIGETRVAPTVLEFELDSPLPSKNRQGMALVDDTLFLFGGNKSLGQHDFGAEFFTDAGFALDLAAMTWRTTAPYPAKRQTMSTFVTAWGHIVSIGGFGHDGEVARSHPEIYAYSPKKNSWKAVGSLPEQGRTQFGLAVRDDEALLFGGLDYDPRRPKGDQFRHKTGLLRAALKPADMSFSATDLELREPRRAFAGAIVGDTYYVVGGMREGFALVDTCEAFNLVDREWKTIACPKHGRLSGQMVAMDGKLYLAAGSSRGEGGKLAPDPSLEVYDPSTDRWRVVAEALPIEPKHVHMVAYGDRLVLLSTHNDAGKAHVVIVDP
ncbi:MAG: hypothetical protein JKY37_21500 [Nannocystaceae bacterium]|nr:hypothetical protein [Nannocystaceae bacterium]